MGNVQQKSTRKISCQYPILDIHDLSFSHKDNVKNNTWHVKKPFPTKEEIKANEPNEEFGIFLPNDYQAEAWVAQGETLTFQVKFEKASHVNVNWKIAVPNDLNDECKTDAIAKPEIVNMDYDVSGGKTCEFPFRYNGILYYGCTRLGTDYTITLCATTTDSDFNANKLGYCNEFCHQQRKFF